MNMTPLEQARAERFTTKELRALAGKFALGDRVVIARNTTHPDMNGQCGRVVKLVKSRAEAAVMLDDDGSCYFSWLETLEVVR